MYNYTTLDCTSGQHWTEKEIGYTADVTLDKEKVKRPMVVGDFRQMPFRDGMFETVVFDPPFVCYLSDSEMGVSKNFGGYKGWNQAVRSLYLGFREVKRVMHPKGVCLFKWGTHDMRLSEALSCCPMRAEIITRRFTNGSSGKTDADLAYWVQLWNGLS